MVFSSEDFCLQPTVLGISANRYQARQWKHTMNDSLEGSGFGWLSTASLQQRKNPTARTDPFQDGGNVLPPSPCNLTSSNLPLCDSGRVPTDTSLLHYVYSLCVQGHSEKIVYLLCLKVKHTKECPEKNLCWFILFNFCTLNFEKANTSQQA